ncbi:putative hydroxylase [Actinacidiphila reveromycinica]|uniref:Putative hydroxylase n=1 Tax=Actinacidiphila reveromycinica TaxID=659352 RepID=A0A7U3UQ14_9ACTN|nr:NAD(P)/FAD-dependent oxidoreductase [Streptomyces sp. SN-593]BBA96677.1 putative hydroxylase [Streptomyces sp. SN-593]
MSEVPYDAIVVGARCAGSATALLLARAGHRVLMVDRASFPSDTMSTLYIQQRGVAHLRRWGLLDRVAARCPALDRVSYTIGAVRLEGCSRPVDGVGAAYAPRRSTLDALLVEAAVAAGVEFRPSCTLDGLLRDEDDRVTGVRLRSRGVRCEERARLVVGADGMRSTLAELAGARTLIEDEPKTCVYYAFWDGAADHFELYEAQDRWIGAVPTDDGQTLVQAYFPQHEYARVRTDAQAAYLEAVRATAPDLHARMLDGGCTERLRGTGHQRNFFREAAGPGWALVGDAGHHRDSITARGITHAFLQAQMLADRVAGTTEDAPRLDLALRSYARERYDALIDDYHDTLSTARLSVPEHRVRMIAEVARDAARTEDFFSAMGGAPRPATADSGARSAAEAVRWMRAQRAQRAAAVKG